MTDRLLAEGRDAYRHFTPITTRWMDNDIYGHVNNVVYYSWFDTAVNGLLIAEGIAGSDSPEAIGLVVGTQCQYFEPVSFPTPVEIGLRVVKLGTSSVTYQLGVFTTQRPYSHATGMFTHVYVDPHARRPVAIPARHRERLARYILPLA
ncbi:thioesterase family protein [Bordetella sp. BOR01]|uniref:acyl-CoA thioesterase n=1 Tax=Bordetella sp. BOR01 TaxID=2854779 RepID=UPI001C488CD3|nr:thioesterase family protein [Bordetella sp. BOR01]MBV7481947.1 acyl-CoA thioesterase [Bordetella sp. BOR01]